MSKQKSVADSAGKKLPPQGLIIFGGESFSGKTVLMTGLCAALQDEGHTVKAIKPVCIGSRLAVEAELSFISRICLSKIDYPVSLLGGPGRLSEAEWAQTIGAARNSPRVTLLELPGSCATPLSFVEDKRQFWRDGADLSVELGWPCLLVVRYGLKTVEQFLLNAESLILRGADLIGLVAVETTADSHQGLYPDNLGLALSERVQVPFLGCIPYSQSISVLDQSQGNLKKLVANSLDLLPVMKRLELPLLV